MLKFNFADKHIELEELPKSFKKITGTRFASILGFNTWSSPFEAWCTMTRLYEIPFEDTIYTRVGKAIESKICEYLKSRYFMDIKSPTDVYGPDYFRQTRGDFYPNIEVLGGMWDFIGDDFIVEVKTTKRVEDWKGIDGKVEPPIYYKLQASLYAYLLNFDSVVMTCSFLQEEDYQKPEAFIPSVDNTVVIEFKVSEAFPDFENEYIKPALTFWEDHVLTGISPEFDEKKDADILKVLRKNITVAEDDEIAELMEEGNKIRASIDEAESKISEQKKRLKEIEDIVKKSMIRQFRDGDKNVEISTDTYTWTITKSERTSLDNTTLKKEQPDLFEKYTKTTNVYTLKTTKTN